ncbi:MAG: phytanoyl-CoA dioxygenase family protein, partial [Planctomycetota bacterium]
EAELIDPDNVRCRFMPNHETGELLFEVFDPVNDLSKILHSVCFDERLTSALDAIYGEPAELFKEKLIYKMPGAKGYDLHQDIPQSWPGWPHTFLTVLLAIDGSNRDNGCTEVYRGYHDRFLSSDPDEYMLPPDCVCESRQEFLELNPGDLAIFHGLTPHGSAANKSAGMRRAFYISYNARSDGGDQRQSHYAAFQEMLKNRRIQNSSGSPYFR